MCRVGLRESIARSGFGTSALRTTEDNSGHSTGLSRSSANSCGSSAVGPPRSLFADCLGQHQKMTEGARSPEKPPNQSHSRRQSLTSPRPPSSPRYETAPQTPDRQGTDPLSAHIFARSQSEAGLETPSFTRNISELVISKFKDDVREEPPSNMSSDVEVKDKKKRVSFFSKLRGKDHTEDDYFETPDEVSRTEGTHACTFSGKHVAERPAYIRVRSRNKAKRDFNNLFLAQELSSERKPASVSTSTSTSTENVSDVPVGSAIWSMKFSIDGRYLATGGQDKIVRVWRVLSSPKDRQQNGNGECPVDAALNAPVFYRKPIREYQGHTADVLDLSWSRNNFLLSSSMDKTVRLWHISEEECLCCFQHSDFVTSIAFHPRDDRLFLSGSLDCKLRLWNIEEKKVSCWNELPELITAVAFDSHGRMAIAGTFTGLCLFYEADGLRYHTQIHVRSSRGRNSKGSKITGLQVVSMSPGGPHNDSKLLVTSNDSRIRIYDLRDKALMMKLKGNENNSSQIRATFNDDCRYVICGSEDKQVYIWDAQPGIDRQKSQSAYEHFEAHTEVISSACFMPRNARELLAASNDPIYDFVTRNQSAIADDQNSVANSEHSLVATSSVDGNIIICADYTGRIKIFRQDSAYSLRVKTADDKSETSSMISKPVQRKSSMKSLDTASKTESIPRKPHEFTAPISPARAKDPNGSLHSGHAPPPEIQINGHSQRPNGSHKSHQSHNGTKEEIKHQGPVSKNEFLSDGGMSLEYYDTSSRPQVERKESSASIWPDSLARQDSGVHCRSCNSTSFAASKKASGMQLKCMNCGLVLA